MKSTLISRNVVVMGRRTSIRLESELWDALQLVCQREDITLNEVCDRVARTAEGSFTSAVRVFIIRYFKTNLEERQPEYDGYSLSRSPAASKFDDVPAKVFSS